MGKLNEIDGYKASYGHKTELIKIAVEAIKGEGLGTLPPEKIKAVIKASIDQVVESYNEL